LLGTILSFASAAFFGLNSATMRRAVLTGTVVQGLAISLPLGFPIFLVAAFLAGSFSMLWEFSSEQYLLLSLGGVIHFAFGRYCNYRATKAMGANLVRPIQQLNVILSLALAMWFLGETLTPLRMLGIVLVLIAPFIMLRDRKKFHGKMQKHNEDKTKDRISFEPNYAEGIIFGVGSALGFGSSAVFVRGALGNMDFTSGIAGGAVSYGAALIVVLIAIASPGRIRHIFAMSAVSAKWFALSAFMISISQMLRYMALAVAPVSVVAPIQQTTVVFQVIFAWFINRDHEAFGAWVLLGILSSLLGAVALSVSTDFVLANFDLPEAVVQFAGWTWP
jgi:drug/metabolite transporter (DMT)-like permease